MSRSKVLRLFTITFSCMVTSRADEALSGFYSVSNQGEESEESDPLKSSKIDCGGWDFPDSHDNAKNTVYGKIGSICTENGRRRSGYKPGNKPYLCWNKHLYGAHVDWGLVTTSLLLLPAWLLIHQIFPSMGTSIEAMEAAGESPLVWWPPLAALVHCFCLISSVVSYLSITARNLNFGGSCGFIVFTTMPLSKTIIFPLIQVAMSAVDDAIFSRKESDKKQAQEQDPGEEPKENQCWRCISALKKIIVFLAMIFGACALLPTLLLSAYLIPLYVCFFPVVLLYTGSYFFYIKAVEACFPNLNERPNSDEDTVQINTVKDTLKFGSIPGYSALALTAVYLGPFYKGRGWTPLATDLLESLNPFVWPRLKLALAWPDNMPVFDQFSFGLSMSVAIADFCLRAIISVGSTTVSTSNKVAPSQSDE